MPICLYIESGAFGKQITYPLYAAAQVKNAFPVCISHDFIAGRVAKSQKTHDSGRCITMLAGAGIDTHIIPVYRESDNPGHSDFKIIKVSLIDLLP